MGGRVSSSAVASAMHLAALSRASPGSVSPGDSSFIPPTIPQPLVSSGPPSQKKARSSRKRKTFGQATTDLSCPACQGKHRAHTCSRRKAPFFEQLGDAPMARKSGDPLPDLLQSAPPLPATTAPPQGVLAMTLTETKTDTPADDMSADTKAATRAEILSRQQIYPVKKLTGKRPTGITTEYLVQWRDYPENLSSWEPTENILSPSLIQDYNQQHPNEAAAILGKLHPGGTSRRGRTRQRFSACADCGSSHSGWGAGRWVGMEKYGRPLCVRCYDRYRKAENRHAPVSRRTSKRSRRAYSGKGEVDDSERSATSRESQLNFEELDAAAAHFDPTFPLSPTSDTETEDEGTLGATAYTARQDGGHRRRPMAPFRGARAQYKTVVVRDSSTNTVTRLPTKAVIYTDAQGRRPESQPPIHATAERALQTLVTGYEAALHRANQATQEHKHRTAEFVRVATDFLRRFAAIVGEKTTPVAGARMYLAPGPGEPVGELTTDGLKLFHGDSSAENKISALHLNAGAALYVRLPDGLLGPVHRVVVRVDATRSRTVSSDSKVHVAATTRDEDAIWKLESSNDWIQLLGSPQPLTPQAQNKDEGKGNQDVECTLKFGPNGHTAAARRYSPGEAPLRWVRIRMALPPQHPAVNQRPNANSPSTEPMLVDDDKRASSELRGDNSELVVAIDPAVPDSESGSPQPPQQEKCMLCISDIQMLACAEAKTTEEYMSMVRSIHTLLADESLDLSKLNRFVNTVAAGSSPNAQQPHRRRTVSSSPDPVAAAEDAQTIPVPDRQPMDAFVEETLNNAMDTRAPAVQPLNAYNTTASGAQAGGRPCEIQVFEPMGGETLRAGDPLRIRWMYAGDCGEYVSIRLYRMRKDSGAWDAETFHSNLADYVSITSRRVEVRLPKVHEKGGYRLEVAGGGSGSIAPVSHSAIFTIAPRAMASPPSLTHASAVPQMVGPAKK